MKRRTYARSRRGAIIVGVLLFLLIATSLLIGVGSLSASHQQRATVDSAYAKAIDLADAGINYEFRKIGNNSSTADQYPGVTYSSGAGTFTVYCSNKDGSTPWSPSQYLYVTATGTVAGVSRTVKVASKGFAPDGHYAIYTIDSISVWKGASAVITGDIGTNGKFSFSADPTINGAIYFNGAAAGWAATDPGIYTEIRKPNPILWPTVDDVANGMFPLGGLTWLSTNNDNATANPPIVGNSITNAVTLTAGNYYVTNINLAGGQQITFDNRAGSVNLWVGPAGANGTCRFRGGTAFVPIALDPTKANHIYVATQTGIDLGGNAQMDALVYAYNKDATGREYGYATNSGNPIVNGQIIANQYDLNGNIRLNYITDLIKPLSYGYYGYDNSWLEVNGR